MVILALANPKIWILASSQAWNIFIHYPRAWIVSKFYVKNMSGNFEFYPVIQHNLILSTSQMEKWNFIQLSDPKLNFILLSGRSAVGQ